MALGDVLVVARAAWRRRALGERAVRSSRWIGPPAAHPCAEAGDGPPLLLVHGMVDQQETWRFGRDAWAKHFRVISFDLPGCNFMPRRGEASAEGYAAFVDDVASALGLDRFFLLGLSFGANVALDYAVRRPDRVAGVVFASLPLARPGHAALRLARQIGRLKRRPWVQALVGRIKRSRPYLHFLVSSVTHGAAANFDFTVALIAHGQISSDALTWLDNYQSVVSFDVDARLDELARSGVPYLAVFGENDRRVSLERLPEIRALDGHARVLPGAHHCVHIEESEAFNQAVIEFLSRCAARLTMSAPIGANARSRTS